MQSALSEPSFRVGEQKTCNAGYLVSFVSSARSNAWLRFWIRYRKPSTRCSEVAGLASLKTRSPAALSRSQNCAQASWRSLSTGASPYAMRRSSCTELDEELADLLGGAAGRLEPPLRIDPGADQLEVEGTVVARGKE